MKYTKFHIGILIFTILYTLIFAYLFVGRGNYEFLGYVVVLFFFIGLIWLLYRRFNFTNGVLLGMSIWGLLHMAGGGIIVNNAVLYAYWIIPNLLKYDMVTHAYGFGMATILSYQILKNSFNKDVSRLKISIFLVFIGMGLGALNEIIEFIATLFVATGVGGYTNTMLDIIFNTIGSIIAVIYINLKN